jgi:DNA (cytosine-5)-methyltransferase 1
VKIGSLFAGIGGLELGLERGLRSHDAHTIWQVEIDPYCRSILAKHWPAAKRYDDIRQVGAHNLERVDILCGGFPCQDLSVAGRQAGLSGDRSGLWYEFARIAGELRPPVIVVENVAHGRGKWLPYVRADLEALGYRTCAYVVAASQVGAPHERSRCFVVAYADGEPLRVGSERGPGGRENTVQGQGQSESLDAGAAWRPAGASTWAAFPEVPGVDDGVPDRMGERALGNAVVPQVGEVIGGILAIDIV